MKFELTATSVGCNYDKILSKYPELSTLNISHEKDCGDDCIIIDINTIEEAEIIQNITKNSFIVLFKPYGDSTRTPKIEIYDDWRE